jgi:hypothetical protein
VREGDLRFGILYFLGEAVDVALLAEAVGGGDDDARVVGGVDFAVVDYNRVGEADFLLWLNHVL